MSNPAAQEQRMITVEWELKRFDELTLDELYDSLRLRVNVFVVEKLLNIMLYGDFNINEKNSI